MSSMVVRSVYSGVAAIFLMATAAAAQQAGSGQDPSAGQEIRTELDRLRREFESIRDTYGARLAALEGRLAQLEGQPQTGPKPVEPLPPPPPTAPPAVPTGAAPGRGGRAGGCGRRGRTARVASRLWGHERAFKDFQPGYCRHRQFPGHGREQ